MGGLFTVFEQNPSKYSKREVIDAYTDLMTVFEEDEVEQLMKDTDPSVDPEVVNVAIEETIDFLDYYIQITDAKFVEKTDAFPTLGLPNEYEIWDVKIEAFGFTMAVRTLYPILDTRTLQKQLLKIGGQNACKNIKYRKLNSDSP